MMNVKDLLPRDKHDFERADRLKQYSCEEIKPIIPDLLEWLQDVNWPISKVVSDYLLSIEENITEEILTIFESNDQIWKYWIILIFGPTTKSKRIQKEIERLAYSATKEEKMEELDKVSLKVIEERRLNS